MSDIPKCPTCGGRASERYAPIDIEATNETCASIGYEGPCPDRFHDLGDWGPEMYEWLVEIRSVFKKWQAPRLDALLERMREK
jgi:hypothetical protein